MLFGLNLWHLQVVKHSSFSQGLFTQCYLDRHRDGSVNVHLERYAGVSKAGGDEMMVGSIPHQLRSQHSTSSTLTEL